MGESDLVLSLPRKIVCTSIPTYIVQRVKVRSNARNSLNTRQYQLDKLLTMSLYCTDDRHVQ